MASVLLDQNVPKRLVPLLRGHDARRAFDLGWSQLSNGDLIAAAERAGFQVIGTADEHLRDQQNIGSRTIAIIVLQMNRWAVVGGNLGLIIDDLASARTGSFTEVVSAPARSSQALPGLDP